MDHVRIGKKTPPQAKLFTAKELSRAWAIEDVLKAYRKEINWAIKNKEAPRFSLDISRPFITARMQREFEEWCPVRLLHNVSWLIVFF